MWLQIDCQITWDMTHVFSIYDNNFLFKSIAEPNQSEQWLALMPALQ